MEEQFQEIINFWIDEIGPSGWYAPPAGLDDRIRDKYLPLWEQLRKEPVSQFSSRATDSLAVLLLLDQFPRNMFRGNANSFATDAKALELAKLSVGRGKDARWSFPARQFYYLPFMHSEILSDQERGLRLFLLADPKDRSNLQHSRAHRWVIREFGRFPYRNEALGRTSTAAEQAFLAAGGYRRAMEEVSEQKV